MADLDTRKKVLRDPVNFLAFGFGTGLAPIAPGTVGSLPGVAIAWLSLPLAIEWRLLIGLLLVVAGIWICGQSARRMGVHDHPGIVWDEIAGMYLVLLTVPPSIVLWALGFLLFRLFDILKPWPIRDLDHRLRGGTGIMLDDLAAALFAALLLGFGRWLMS
ncbi:MAG: phosphatidylglycerophosphatase A [Gammaproteobacteria bacterium]|nr:phosphatidylglycerophosphatase A [Gammaproteobacteria bacterium]MDH4314815.1 phosphatidylglycerophosphatase A [Gammaproteobacteria bacterium]MDH5213090.1 phosphatidylglycerophosphatase A [Gammaproteobacteria bacterium]MDH5499866.1 phosphatidylglycerophosphatase A [Gammaproteobacteria bacterium]